MHIEPKISIVIPTYNQGIFIEDTIKSIIYQNYVHKELIIIDGNSDDNTLDIIKKYERYIAYWISENDEGQSDALIKGFSYASGDLYYWINSDDMLFPNALYNIFFSYNKNPYATLYLGDLLRCNKYGKIYKYIKFVNVSNTSLKHGIVNFGQPSTFFNANIYHKVGGINKNLHMRMDHDLFLKMLLYKNNVQLVNAPLSVLRDHERRKWVVKKKLGYHENSLYRSTLNKNKIKLNIVRLIFKVSKLIKGNYIKSYYMTLFYTGKSIYKYWKNAIKDQK